MVARRGGDLTGEDRRIWARVTGSVAPARPLKAPRIAVAGPPPVDPTASGLARPAPKPALKPATGSAPLSRPALQTATPRGVPEVLEPRRQRRLSRERDPIEARIDLHGYGRFQAQDALTAFLTGAQARGYRAVLVITGQGRRGGTGVIRGSVHEWLTGPTLRGVVSGFAAAARHHGGDGALYVTLKRPG
ncbi:Smr/MutS family protein [uncultured Brevundimonas sp.]|uniref:Smr/MutS family protein n=1 Tax=uncultured Brevundimonas sp. TaxID=213418 RepID=UPI0030EDA472|tara:strand:+ start:120888 stop:121457 length:570 start_codon:yes stop_codon:yes gene_type:complete